MDAGATAADASVAADVGATPVDAGPGRLEVSLLAGLADGGVSALAVADGGCELDSTRILGVTFGAELQDFRVRLVDWTDKVVASDDEAKPFDGGLEYRLELLEPLASGRTYTLSVDAQRGASVTDVRGAAYEDASVLLRVRGDVQAPARPTKSPKRKAR